MAWITYESDRIVHLPSNTQITMRSYKIAWNDDNDKHSMVIDHRIGDKVYNLENENGRRRCKSEHAWIWDAYAYDDEAGRDRSDEEVDRCVAERFDKRYLVVLGRESQNRRSKLEMEDRNEHLSNLTWVVGVKDRWDDNLLKFDNLTTHFAITFSDGRSGGRRKLLFISTDREEFETAKRALQSKLATVRLDELKGKPSGCKDGIYETFWKLVLGQDTTAKNE